MISREIIRKLILESLSEFEENENFKSHFEKNMFKKSKPELGNYVWPIDNININADIEKNTFVEDLLKSELEKVFEERQKGNYHPISSFLASHLKDITSSMTYPDIFQLVKPEDYQYLYRGLVLERRDFESLFGKIPDDAGDFFEKVSRDLSNTFNSFLFKLTKMQRFQKKDMTWIQRKTETPYSDSDRFIQDDSISKTKKTIGYSFWTDTLSNAAEYSLAARQKFTFIDPVIVVITANTNFSDFLKLDPLIYQYLFIKQKAKGTPKNEFILLGDAIINSIYVFYDKHLLKNPHTSDVYIQSPEGDNAGEGR